MTITIEETIENYERRILGIPTNTIGPGPLQMAAHDNGSEICIHVWNIALSGDRYAPTIQVTEEIHRQKYDSGGFYLVPDETE